MAQPLAGGGSDAKCSYTLRELTEMQQQSVARYGDDLVMYNANSGDITRYPTWSNVPNLIYFADETHERLLWFDYRRTKERSFDEGESILWGEVTRDHPDSKEWHSPQFVGRKNILFWNDLYYDMSFLPIECDCEHSNRWLMFIHLVNKALLPAHGLK